MTTQIGKVTLEYDQTGQLISSLFELTMKVTLDNVLQDELKKIECCTVISDLEHNASLVLASFFNRMNNIELRDVATTEIKSHVDQVEQYENKRIKKAVITYSFVETTNMTHTKQRYTS